tara:strand:+ start:1135 stop:1497 length:363 start_codon:yes stop_codon:yes gene_type:complete
MKKIILFTFSLFLLSSCATIFTGTTETIQFDSNVKGATVEMDGVEVGKTPMTMKVKKSFNGVMSVSADGYETKRFELQKSFNSIAILNLFGILQWGIDLATGAINKFDRKGYDITLEKED